MKGCQNTDMCNNLHLQTRRTSEVLRLHQESKKEKPKLNLKLPQSANCRDLIADLQHQPCTSNTWGFDLQLSNYRLHNNTTIWYNFESDDVLITL